MICTQPRRKAVTNIAARIADGYSTTLDSPTCPVGYRIKDEKKGRQTPIQLVTTGWLLQMMVYNPGYLAGFTHIILDEVHERDIDSDIVFFLVKKLLLSPEMAGTHLVLMSATLDTSLFEKYFGEISEAVGTIVVNQQLYPVDTLYLDGAHEYQDAINSRAVNALFNFRDTGGRPFDVRAEQTLFSPKLEQLWQSTIVDVVQHAVNTVPQTEETGAAILVFLPGMQAIDHIHDGLLDAGVGVSGSDVAVHPFHSEVDPEDAMFNAPPPGVVHVVLATSIAETSLTIPQVRLIIDTGVCKQPIGDEDGNIVLRPYWISQSSARQRSGRTGRTCGGAVLRLYPRWFMEKGMQVTPLSSIRSLPLENVVLKLLTVNASETPQDTIMSMIEQPPSGRLKAALRNTFRYGYTTTEHNDTVAITSLGERACNIGLSMVASSILFSAVATGSGGVLRLAVIAVAMLVDKRMPYIKAVWRFSPEPELFAQLASKRDRIGRMPPAASGALGDAIPASDLLVMAEHVHAWVTQGQVPSGGAGRVKTFAARRGLQAQRWSRFMSTVHSVCRSTVQTFGKAGTEVIEALSPLMHKGVRDLAEPLFDASPNTYITAGIILGSVRDTKAIVHRRETVSLPDDEVRVGPGLRAYLTKHNITRGGDIDNFLTHTPCARLVPGTSCKSGPIDMLGDPKIMEVAIDMVVNAGGQRDAFNRKGAGYRVGVAVASKDGFRTVKKLQMLVFDISIDATHETHTPSTSLTEPVEFIRGALTVLSNVSISQSPIVIILPSPARIAQFMETGVPMREGDGRNDHADGPNRPAPGTLQFTLTFLNCDRIKPVGTVGSESVASRRALLQPYSPVHDLSYIPLAVQRSMVNGKMTEFIDSIHMLNMPTDVIAALEIVFGPLTELRASHCDGKVTSVSLSSSAGEYPQSVDAIELTVEDVQNLVDIRNSYRVSVQFISSRATESSIMIGASKTPWVASLDAVIDTIGSRRIDRKPESKRAKGRKCKGRVTRWGKEGVVVYTSVDPADPHSKLAAQVIETPTVAAEAGAGGDLWAAPALGGSAPPMPAYDPGPFMAFAAPAEVEGWGETVDDAGDDEAW